MPLPSGIATITVTGRFLDSFGNPQSGNVIFNPPPQLIDPTSAIIYAKPTSAHLDSTGSFSVTLVCTDNPPLLPIGWHYTVVEQIGGASRSYPIYLPHTLGSSVDLSAVTPIPTQAGTPALIPSGRVAPGYAALAYDNTFSGAITFTGTVTMSGYLADGSAAGGDLSGTYPSPTVAKVNGIQVSGTPSTGQVITATSSTTATWQNQSGGSGGANLDTNAADIAALGAQAAGATGKAADAGHVHPMPTLDQVGTAAANVSVGGHKLTSLAAGSASTDAANIGQLPTTLPPSGSATGDLSGSYPGPTVARVNGVAVTGTPAAGQVITASSGTAAAWSAPAVASVNGATGAVSVTAAGIGALAQANNLADVSSPAASRTSLGLGTAATANISASAGDISALGTQAAGASGRVADAAHVHPAPTLDQLSAAANVSLGNHKLTAVTAGVAGTDAVNVSQLPTALPPSGAAGGDLAGTYPNPTVSATANFKAQVETVRLDQMAAPTAAVNINSQKLTSLAAGSASTDAANIGQIPTTLPPSGSASGDLSGSYPGPTVARVNGVAVTGTPAGGQVLTASSSTAASWAAPATVPSPATTVVSETGYGQSTAVGTLTSYALEDHTHGSPSLTTSAPATTLGIGQAAALGTATTPAKADHVHPLAAAAAPAASAVGDSAVTGVATTFSASDHKHAREAFGAVTALAAFNTASANGTAATVAHSDHVHGAPALPTATTGAAGIVQLDGTAGDIAALGAQAAGATGKAADAGHVHPTTGLVLAASLPLSIANGGTGQTTGAAALNALATVVWVPAPTGVAATDQANINAAIAALPAGGGLVQLQAGTYVVPAPGSPSNGCVNMSVNSATLAGMGVGVTVIQLAPGSTGVTGIVRTPSGVQNSKITFRDFTIDGNKASQTGSPVIIGFFCGVTPNSTQTDTDITLTRVEAMNCTGYGFDPHERTTRLLMVGCVSHDNGSDGAHDGFTLDGQYDSTLIGCVAYANGRHGFNLVTASTRVRLIGCESYGNTGAGYVMQNGTKYSTLSGCTAYNNSLEGILLNGVAQSGQQDNTPGSDNTVLGCTVALSGTHGIHLVGSLRSSVIGNVVRDSSQTATNSSNQIYLDESGAAYTTDCTVTGNDLDTTGVANVPKWGVFEKTSNEDRNLVANNKSTGAGTGAISLAGTTSIAMAAHNGTVGEHPASFSYAYGRTPAQRGYLDMLSDPGATAFATQALVSGTVYGSAMVAQTGGVYSKLCVGVSALAITPTAGENLLGLYQLISSTWTQIGITADLGTWSATGEQEFALTAATGSIAPGTLLMCCALSVATTPAKPYGPNVSSIAMANAGLSTAAASPYQYCVVSTGSTALPGSFASSTISATGALPIWWALK